MSVDILLVASMAAAELRTILGVEVSGPQFLAACKAADEKISACYGPPLPKMGADELTQILCDIALEQGFKLTCNLEPLEKDSNP